MLKTNVLTDWLIQDSPWVEYRTRIDLLGQTEDHPDVISARKSMLSHPQIISMIDALADWPGHPLKRHNDATHPIHKLVFLADIGVQATDPGMKKAIDAIASHRSDEGLFKIVMNISPHYGGNGKDQWVWMLCDTPLILYALLKMEADVPGLTNAANYLAELCTGNGWTCRVCPELRNFKGPGRKTDPCPYANLISLKALTQVPDLLESDACHSGAETLLSLWTLRKEKKPFLFGMGTDFKKLKTPNIWYDILHVLDVLTQFPWLKDDPRLNEMLAILAEKTDDEQRFTAESVWKAWKEWDFGQKKVPSAWITFMSHRILERANLPK